MSTMRFNDGYVHSYSPELVVKPNEHTKPKREILRLNLNPDEAKNKVVSLVESLAKLKKRVK